MKDFITSVQFPKHGKAKILHGDAKHKSNKENFESSFLRAPSFESFQYSYNKTSSTKNVYDCNANLIAAQPQNTLRRAISWTGNFPQRVQNKTKKISLGPLQDSTQISTIQEAFEEATRRGSKRIKKHIRRVSDGISTLSRKSNSDEKEETYIDFGRCYYPTEMKHKIILDKLNNSVGNMSTYVRGRSFTDTFKENAKKFRYNSMQRKENGPRKHMSNSITRESNILIEEDSNNPSQKDSKYSQRQDSTSSQRKTSSSNLKLNNTYQDTFDDDIIIPVESVDVLNDVSRNRENVDKDIFDYNFPISSNMWYHGNLNMQFIKTNEEGSTNATTFMTSILVRIDKYGEMVYSLTYESDGDLCTGAFPFDGKRYCLDFLDPNQPRFAGLKYLLAFLIGQGILKRVSFNWLIENCSDIF